jgi:hypothetical protein
LPALYKGADVIGTIEIQPKGIARSFSPMRGAA